MRVLLIEDDLMFGRALVRGLTDEGMAVDWAKDGATGEASIVKSGYAVVLLDIGLPKVSGLDVLKRFRARRNSAPILIITARDGLDDMVAGLDLGADDYIVKPFELRALLARMRAVMRRVGGRSQMLMMSAEITLDPATHEATFRGRTHVLSAKEFSVLHALMERPGTILSRGQIEDRIYGWSEEIQSNAVDVLIHGLRRRFGKDIIRNVRGAGWLVMKDGA